MNMFEQDVEFFDEFQADEATLKASIWKDEDFKDYIRAVGLKETLYDVTTFHRSVAENLKMNQVTDLKVASDTQKSAVNLVVRLKSRRAQLRKIVREAYGQEVVEEINARVDQEMDD